MKDGKISNFMQVASVRRYEMTEGQGKGLRMIECDNGKIRFLLNESKGLDISQLWYEGQNISFVSKNGFSAQKTPFLSCFEGGMLYTCGLDSFGDRVGYPMHGSYHHTAARVTKIECDEEGITVEAEMTATALFGKNFLFKRRVFTAIQGEEVRITDTLTNVGFQAAPYCLLYHVNVGYPMLDEGAKLLLDTEKVEARTPFAKANEGTMYEMTDCIVGQEEVCYFVSVRTPHATLVNGKLGKRFTLSWSKDTLPCLIEWKSMGAGDYALGLEPCTSTLDDGFAYRTLEAGASVTMQLALGVCKG